MGGAEGRLYVYDIGELASPPEDAWTKMQETVAKLLAPPASSAAAAPSAPSTGPLR